MKKLYASPPPRIFKNVLPFSTGKTRKTTVIMFRATNLPMKYKITPSETVRVQYLIHAMPP